MSLSVVDMILGPLLVAAAGYLALALVRLRALRPSAAPLPAVPLAPVTVLKPLCGLDPELEANLRSFCRQDYPCYQILFGVRREEDPAVPLVRRLIADYPEQDIQLVIDGTLIGPNRKVGNLANLLPHARHEILVVADSDMRVGPDYLAAVAAPFADPAVGAATCPYFGVPRGGLASRLGALYISDWFLPSVLVATALAEPDFCLGATMAVRRRALEGIGGFAALAGYLADDFQLGNQLRRAGWTVRLVPYLVEDVVFEADLRALFAHELRWARTVRACRPAGYAFSFIASGGLSLALLYLLVAGFSGTSLAAATLLYALRAILHGRLRRLAPTAQPTAYGLLPVRDLLAMVVWGAGLCGRRVAWRGRRFRLRPGGQMTATFEGPRRVMITADDFGLSMAVNEAVEQAHCQGILTAAELMVAEAAAADAVARARRCPQLRIGLHLVVSRGRAVSPPAQIPALVAAEGRFDSNLLGTGLRYFFRPGVRRQLEREIRAQFQAFVATGLPLDHLSVHNHLQLHPTILGLILRVGRDFGLPAVRLPAEPLAKGDLRRPTRLLPALALAPWVALCRWRLELAGMAGNDRLFGIRDAGHIDAERLASYLHRLPAGYSEIHLHPATDGGDQPASWAPPTELQALLAPKPRQILKERGIHTGGYADFSVSPQPDPAL